MDSRDDMQASVRISGDKSSGRGDSSFRARDPLTVIIFGASGDLSKRKLIPALYHLEQAGFLPERYAVVGFSRTEMTDEAYRDRMIGEMRQDFSDVDDGSPCSRRSTTSRATTPTSSPSTSSRRGSTRWTQSRTFRETGSSISRWRRSSLRTSSETSMPRD